MGIADIIQDVSQGAGPSLASLTCFNCISMHPCLFSQATRQPPPPSHSEPSEERLDNRQSEQCRYTSQSRWVENTHRSILCVYQGQEIFQGAIRRAQNCCKHQYHPTSPLERHLHNRRSETTEQDPPHSLVRRTSLQCPIQQPRRTTRRARILRPQEPLRHLRQQRRPNSLS